MFVVAFFLMQFYKKNLQVVCFIEYANGNGFICILGYFCIFIKCKAAYTDFSPTKIKGCQEFDNGDVFICIFVNFWILRNFSAAMFCLIFILFYYCVTTLYHFTDILCSRERKCSLLRQQPCRIPVL